MEDHSKSNAPDLSNFWMPFTANRQFKAAPRLLASAEGMYYTDIDGKKILDGTAGLWCVNAGHGRRRISQAVERQLATLDFAPTFQMGHPIAFEFAEKLAAMAPVAQTLSLIGFSSPVQDRNPSIPRSKSQLPISAQLGRERAAGSSGVKKAITALVLAAFPLAASSTTAASSRKSQRTICATRWIWIEMPSPRVFRRMALNWLKTLSVLWPCTAQKPLRPSSSNPCPVQLASSFHQRDIFSGCALLPISTASF